MGSIHAEVLEDSHVDTRAAGRDGGRGRLRYQALGTPRERGRAVKGIEPMIQNSFQRPQNHQYMNLQME